MAKNDRDKAPSFEDAMGELEQIIEELEGGELPLEESLTKYEKGMAALKLCRDILDKAEKKIEILVKDDAGGVEAQPFDEPDDAET